MTRREVEKYYSPSTVRRAIFVWLTAEIGWLNSQRRELTRIDESERELTRVKENWREWTSELTRANENWRKWTCIDESEPELTKVNENWREWAARIVESERKLTSERESVKRANENWWRVHKCANYFIYERTSPLEWARVCLSGFKLDREFQLFSIRGDYRSSKCS